MRFKKGTFLPHFFFLHGFKSTTSIPSVDGYWMIKMKIFKSFETVELLGFQAQQNKGTELKSQDTTQGKIISSLTDCPTWRLSLRIFVLQGRMKPPGSWTYIVSSHSENVLGGALNHEKWCYNCCKNISHALTSAHPCHLKKLHTSLNLFLREPQHTPGDTPGIPEAPNERNSFINCWLGVWGMFQGYVGKNS